MNNKKIKGFAGWVKTSIWAFPLALFLVLVVLTSLRLSGTSVGMYYSNLYGSHAKDPNLIWGHPRAIRSDEWLAGSQMTVSQSKNGYPRFNKDFGSGRDVSLAGEIPSKDWSTIFKPQNWSFMILPLEFAFAFKWWLLMFLLILSVYFFVLRVFPGQKVFAILIGIAIGLSPFSMWWYQTGSFLTLAWGFFILIMFLRLINGEQVPFVKNKLLSDALHVIGLSFLLGCFGFIFYPPFQISVALVIGFFILGYTLQKLISEKFNWADLAKRLGLVLIATVVTAVIGLTFVATHRGPINGLNQSLYPGHRRIDGGALKLLNVFDSYVMPVQQSDFRGGHFIYNQSEASNFILLLPFLLIPGFAVIWLDWRKHKKIDFILLSLQICALLMFIRVFTKLGGPLFNLLLLDRVPSVRLIIGMGFLGILQMLYLIKKINTLKIKPRQLYTWALGYGLACLAVLLMISAYIMHHYPLFLHNPIIISGLAIAFTVLIIALLSGHKMLFAICFLMFTLASSFKIIPLYRGLGFLTHSNLVQRMEAISSPKDSWVTVGDDAGVYENFGWLAGRRSLSGAQLYPDLNFWKQLAGQKYEYIYNREGHAFFSDSPNFTVPIDKVSSDSFKVKFKCSSFILKNIQYALSVHPLTEQCVSLKEKISYPQTDFYLYKVGK